MREQSPQPRTWFAHAPRGETVFIRRFENPDGGHHFEIYGYTGALADDVTPLDLSDLPDEVASLDAAMTLAHTTFGTEKESFRDVTLGRRVARNIFDVLRTGSLEPLRPGLDADDCVALLGIPEAVTRLASGVSWFYGSVQIHLLSAEIAHMEIDRGISDFTSLVLDGWFLDTCSTIQDVVTRLAAEGIPHRQEYVCGLPAVVMNDAGRRAPMLIDFSAEGDLHAFYWNSHAAIMDRR